MAGKEAFLEQLARLEREHEVRMSNEEWVQTRLRWEDWGTLEQEAAEFARQEIRGRKWRGARSGVLPGGYDAASVAAEAVRELLGGNCRLAAGFLRSKVTAELERLVRQKVRSLHRLKEAPTTRSEWEVEPPNAEGQAVSVLPAIRDGGSDAYETMVAREEEERRERIKGEITEFLKGEPELAGIFGCLWVGITKPSEIGRRLGMEEKAVIRGRKRLDRRLAEFGRTRVEGSLLGPGGED